jgi:hypothetical protein
MKKLSLFILLMTAVSITKNVTASWFSSSYAYKHNTVYKDARGNKQTCRNLIEDTKVPFDPTQAEKYFDAFHTCAVKYPNTAEKYIYANKDKLDVIAVVAALKARDFRFSDDFNRKMLEENKAYGFMTLVEYVGRAINAINDFNENNKDDRK